MENTKRGPLLLLYSGFLAMVATYGSSDDSVGLAFGPPLPDLNISTAIEMLYRYLWSWVDEAWRLQQPFDLSGGIKRFTFEAFQLNVLTTIGEITMKFHTDIHVPHKMNCKNTGDPLTSHLAPSSGQINFLPDKTPA